MSVRPESKIGKPKNNYKSGKVLGSISGCPKIHAWPSVVIVYTVKESWEVCNEQEHYLKYLFNLGPVRSTIYHICNIPGKNFNNDGKQKINRNLSFGFWLIFCNFTSFFAPLRHLWHLNDGNQLPGCRLSSSYDMYILYISRIDYSQKISILVI